MCEDNKWDGQKQNKTKNACLAVIGWPGPARPGPAKTYLACRAVCFYSLKITWNECGLPKRVLLLLVVCCVYGVLSRPCFCIFVFLYFL